MDPEQLMHSRKNHPNRDGLIRLLDHRKSELHTFSVLKEFQVEVANSRPRLVFGELQSVSFRNNARYSLLLNPFGRLLASKSEIDGLGPLVF